MTEICALIDGAPEAIVARSFTSVSRKPPYVSVCITPYLDNLATAVSAGRLGVSVVAAAHRGLRVTLLAGPVPR